MPFIAVGGAVLVFVPLTFLLVGNMSEYSIVSFPGHRRLNVATWE